MASEIQSFEVQGTFGQVVAAAESALNAAGVKIKHSDRQGGAMFGRTPWSISAFGETVTVQIRPSGANRCRIDVHSQMFQALDLRSKNRKNIAAFQRALDQELAGVQPPGTDNQRFCIHCGTELPVAARFCGRCGSPTEASSGSLKQPAD
jgi:hypothetical protein